MRRWRRLLPALSAGALLIICCAPGRAQASQEAAKRYFQNGVELITGSEPNYQDAFYQFQLAYQESAKSWKVLGNLGLCALKLERDADALNYYEQYFKKGGNEIAPEERNAIDQDCAATWRWCISRLRSRTCRSLTAAPAAKLRRSPTN